MFMLSVTILMYYVFKLLKSFDIVSVINVLTSRAKPKNTKKQIMLSEKKLWGYFMQFFGRYLQNSYKSQLQLLKPIFSICITLHADGGESNVS